MDFLDQNLTYSKTFKNLFIKGNLKKIIYFRLIKSIQKKIYVKEEKLVKVGRNKEYKSSISKLVQRSWQCNQWLQRI